MNKDIESLTQRCYVLDDDKLFFPESKQLQVGLQKYVLRNKTAEVLLLLVQTPEHVVPTATFFDVVWAGKYVSENVLKQSISELRQCFNDKNKMFIKTISKRGYSLKSTVSLTSSNTAPLQSHESIAVESVPPASGSATSSLRAAVNQIELDVESQGTRPRIKSNNSFELSSMRWHVFLLVVLALMYTAYRQIDVSQGLSAENKMLKGQLSIYSDLNASGSVVAFPRQVNTLTTLFSETLNGERTTHRQVGEMLALKDIFTNLGEHKEAQHISDKLVRAAANIYGRDSIELFRTKLTSVNNLIALERPGEAYNLSLELLHQALKDFPEDALLLADTRRLASVATLYCVEPICYREFTLNDGLKRAEQAFDYYKANITEFPVRLADTYLLLSWYTFNAEKKKSRVEHAYQIFFEQLGREHIKTITAQEELGRILAFYYQNWEKAELLLLATEQMRQQNFPNGYYDNFKTKLYLGELYFMSGQFQKAIVFLTKAKALTAKSVGVETDAYLEQIMLKSRAHLYSGNIHASQTELEEAYEILNKSDMIVGNLVRQALSITQMRLTASKDESEPSLSSIHRKISKQKDGFKAPGVVPIHEFQSQVLQHYPQKIDTTYIESLKKLVGDPSETSRYFYPADLMHVLARANRLCKQASLELCRKIKSIESTATHLKGQYIEKS